MTKSKYYNDDNPFDRIRADIYSRQNYLNGKYKLGKFGLEFGDKDYNPESPERIKKKADLADDLIAKAEEAGKDTNNKDILLNLGSEAKSIMGTSISAKESKMTAVMNMFQLIMSYGIALGFWGLVFNKGFITYAIYGAIIGLILGVFFYPIFSKQRSKEKIQEASFIIGGMWINLAIVIGILGLIIWIIKLII